MTRNIENRPQVRFTQDQSMVAPCQDCFADADDNQLLRLFDSDRIVCARLFSALHRFPRLIDVL
jgi:hypothetical protein